jgi:hypothetical protein
MIVVVLTGTDEGSTFIFFFFSEATSRTVHLAIWQRLAIA